MQEINKSINNFEDCMKCTICTAYCPVVPVNPLFPGPKQGGPDGERLRLKNKFFFDENLKYCLNCKRCEISCPSGVKIADIIHSARMNYSKSTPSLRDRILANTDFMGKLSRPFAPIVNKITDLSITKNIMDIGLGIDKHRSFPKYKFNGFRKWFKNNKLQQQSEYKKQLAFFHGCSTEFQQPEVGVAFVEVMNALGYGVNLINEECCGVAMISNGLFNSAKKKANHNITEFEKTDLPIITVSSTCTFTMRDEYSSILRLDNSKVKNRIELFEKFLCKLIDNKEITLVFKDNYSYDIAYHQPCHVEKLGWSIFTKYLLEKIPNINFIPLDSNCCGIAGTYGFKKENYANSQEIGRPLFEQIKRYNPDFIACECETCKWQIEMSTGYKVLNPIIILRDALDLEKTRQANISKQQ